MGISPCDPHWIGFTCIYVTQEPSVLRTTDVGGAWFVFLVNKNVKHEGEGDKPAKEPLNSCLSKWLKRTWRSETKAVNQIWINPVLRVGRIDHKICFCYSIIQLITQWHFKPIRSAVAEQFYYLHYTNIHNWILFGVGKICFMSAVAVPIDAEMWSMGLWK